VRVQSALTGSTKEEDMDVEGGGGPLTAIEALKEACATLGNQCDLVLEQLGEAANEVKLDRERMDRLAEEDRMNEDEEEEEEAQEEE